MVIITTDTALEMDYSKKLEIKFSNKKPIQLSDLSQSLLAIGSQYESITDKPVKVIFENNAVKKAMLKGEPRFKKPWNELAYLVDIKVQTVRNLPKVYTIINYYDEDTFDPNE
jgi:hypothetical protein